MAEIPLTYPACSACVYWLVTVMRLNKTTSSASGAHRSCDVCGRYLVFEIKTGPFMPMTEEEYKAKILDGAVAHQEELAKKGKVMSKDKRPPKLTWYMRFGKFRFRVTGANGEKVAHGQGYTRMRSMVETLDTFVKPEIMEAAFDRQYLEQIRKE